MKMVWLLLSMALVSSASAMENSSDEATNHVNCSEGAQSSPVKAVQQKSPQKQSPIKERSVSYDKWKRKANKLGKNFTKLNSMLPYKEEEPSKRLKVSFGLIFGANNVANTMLKELQDDFGHGIMTKREYDSLRTQIESDRYNFLKSPTKKPKLS